MYRVLFIDYDGTLHDSDAKYAAMLDGVLGLKGLDIWRAYLHVHRGIVHPRYPEKHDDYFFHQKLLFEHLKKPFELAAALDLAERFREAQEECWTRPVFFPDALPFLDRVKDGHVLCLTTGDNAPEKVQALEKAGGKRYFSYALDKDRLGLKGGSPSYYRNAVMSTKALPEEVLVIGDSLEHDMAAARRAGLATLWVNRKGHALAENRPSPDHQVRDLTEALAYVVGP